jgi:alkylation response protein AidB-like acyl-CoA dehydrogenase
MGLPSSPRQQALIDLAYQLARERFAPRAARHDREASFPVDDYADLHASGLLALCVPEQYAASGQTLKPTVWWRSNWREATPPPPSPTICTALPC